MKQVPLSGRVIFSDWHGVLSRDPFWVSIRSSATHPLRQQLEAGMAGVFASDRNIANEWMKGLLSSDQVIAEMGIQLDGRFREDFLARRLDIDCARMKVNAELFEVLRAIGPRPWSWWPPTTWTASPAPLNTPSTGGGMLSMFAVGCPACNKIAVILLGTSGALNLWAPVQPVLGVA